MLKKLMSCLICMLMVIGICKTPTMAISEVTASGTQKAYIVGDDWGPAVTKTVIELDKAIDSSSVSKEKFNVVEEKQSYTNQPVARTVTDAYTSDANGNKVESSSNYITIEMYVSPSEGSPFFYNFMSGRNVWCETYKLNVSLVDGMTLTAGEETVNALAIEADINVSDPAERICPQLDDFDTTKTYTATDGTTYSYAEYLPAEDNQKNSLVIWLHGAGEGGVDPTIDLLANEVTALAGDEFQELFKGAYVLAPQSPTMWMDDGTGAYQNGDKGSCYAESLFELIETYVKSNEDIDTNRIIIGGCSNGGYMTMEMILKHPDYFAAAYPICEAFQDQYISDEQIESIKDMPIWFTYAKTDRTVNPELCTEATVARLIEAGAKNIHVSAFEDVHDTTGRFTNADGTPYTYDGHWSWVYFDNNECYDENGVNAWQWLAKQNKVQLNYASGTQKAYIVGDDWGPAVTKTVIELDKAIDSSSVSKEKFNVVEEKQSYTNQPVARTVTDAYTSDANGNKVESSSNYITIEMYVSPSEGSPFFYNFMSGRNVWCETYKLNVSLVDGMTLTAGEETVNALAIEADINVSDPAERICPQLDDFDTTKTYTATDGTTYSYAEYLPAEDNQKNSLVIWLHGAGEGGVDPTIDLLANEVTALAGDEFQELFKGAYVLAPQSPTMWMDDGTGAYQNGDKGSCYAESLFELIETYVKSNEDIDTNRIIIGGCSNGGYMTMEMILKHPDYFAAAYPICEAFQDQYISDEQIESIKDMPIWFTYAKTDRTVNPELCTEATVARLIEAGAKNIHVSAFEDVHDTTGRFTNADGTPYTYDGHWSWVYFDNNECYDENGVNAWQWLAKQNKVSGEVVDKTALKIAVDLANAITDEDLANVVPAVADEFIAARNEANTIYNDASATQEQVNNAFDRLANAMHMLDFKQGDKTALKAFIDKVSGLEAAKYTEATWTVFETELNEAVAVYEDLNAMQEEVNNAYSELVTAFLNLRLIPDKSLLEELINKAEGLNGVNYTKASYAVVENALLTAKAVYENPNATQEEVDNAKATLEKAIAGLQANPSTPSNVENTVKTPVNNGDTTSVKTGDDVNMLGTLAGLALLSIVGAKVLRKKEDSCN